MPHSLGWVYAAVTEYLGFRAYDGEYKVMGLAAYGRPDRTLLRKLDCLVHARTNSPAYQVDPTYLHAGTRSYSDRFTDKLVTLLGRPPRRPDEPIADWHQDL